MDLPFDNIGVTNLVSNDVLEGEDVDVINEDGFNSDLVMMIVRIKSLHEVTAVKLIACREALNKKKTTFKHKVASHKKMDKDSTYMVAASKVSMLKPVDEGVETTIETCNSRRKGIKKAVEKRLRGNVATKKTQMNLLKQQYENFNASSLEVLDQTFNRIQKLISQLEIHGESILHEDVNQKFLRRNFMPPKPDFSGLKEFVNEPMGSKPTDKKPVDETSKAKASADKLELGNPQQDIQDKGVINEVTLKERKSLAGVQSKLEIDGEFVSFRGNSKKGKITKKGKIRTSKLDFEDVYFVKELKFNLFSVSQMCDKKNSVLFTDTACVVLSPDFKLTNESYVLLKGPRKDNMYSVDLKNVFPQGGLTCLFSKASFDESTLWHRRLGHVNFKTINKVVKGNLVRGIENLIDLRVKVIRCDNGTEFKNMVMNHFCEMKSIKREFSAAKTLQQNRVAKRKNKTLIEATRTMLADLKLPTTFWAEAVNTACYV
nr:ribonuclease H-like domain-containing protein [Tanacetum cinerariifolium]